MPLLTRHKSMDRLRDMVGARRPANQVPIYFAQPAQQPMVPEPPYQGQQAYIDRRPSAQRAGPQMIPTPQDAMPPPMPPVPAHLRVVSIPPPPQPPAVVYADRPDSPTLPARCYSPSSPTKSRYVGPPAAAPAHGIGAPDFDCGPGPTLSEPIPAFPMPPPFLLSSPPSACADVHPAHRPTNVAPPHAQARIRGLSLVTEEGSRMPQRAASKSTKSSRGVPSLALQSEPELLNRAALAYAARVLFALSRGEPANWAEDIFTRDAELSHAEAASPQQSVVRGARSDSAASSRPSGTHRHPAFQD